MGKRHKILFTAMFTNRNIDNNNRAEQIEILLTRLTKSGGEMYK